MKVDVVVICEGGQHASLQQLFQGGGTDGTLDALYWEQVVETLGIGKRFHFKSAGDKTNLLSIADDVASNGINTVTVCLDRDYDWHLGKRVTHDRVAYTYGYSWENDITSIEALQRFMESYIGRGTASRPISQGMAADCDVFSRSLVSWCEKDMAAIARSRGSVFDRDRPSRSLRVLNGVTLQTATLQARLTAMGYRRGPNRVGRLSRQSIHRDCYGKLIAKARFHIFLGWLRRAANLTVQYETFARQLIFHTQTLLRAGHLPDYARHLATMRPAF